MFGKKKPNKELENCQYENAVLQDKVTVLTAQLASWRQGYTELYLENKKLKGEK